MADSIPSCRSWRCFIQDNFTVVALLILLLASLGMTVGLMHEASIDDKYVTWMEGWDLAVLAALTLALRTSGGGNHQGDTVRAGDNTVIMQAAPESDKAGAQ